MSIQQAIRLNNHAISLLKSKIFNNAVMISCDALQMFQQYQQSGAQSSSEEQEHNTVSIDRFMASDNHEKLPDESIDEFIYEHGVFLPADTIDPTVIIPVLIFNCALSHQLLALHANNQRASRQFLDRARGLYQLAYEQLDENSNVLFKFTVVNNIGIVHKWLGNYQESKSCFEQLVSTMMIYVDVGTEEIRQLQPIQGFWNNVMEAGSMAPAA